MKFAPLLIEAAHQNGQEQVQNHKVSKEHYLESSRGSHGQFRVFVQRTLTKNLSPKQIGRTRWPASNISPTFHQHFTEKFTQISPMMHHVYLFFIVIPQLQALHQPVALIPSYITVFQFSPAPQVVTGGHRWSQLHLISSSHHLIISSSHHWPVRI